MGAKLLFVFSLISLLDLDDSKHIDGFGTPYIGVAYHRGLYYAVSSDTYIPIYVSTDLENWTYETTVFNVDNTPPWYFFLSPPFTPEIHVLSDTSFRVYFSAIDEESISFALGAAAASNILGPYESSSRPLFSTADTDMFDPTLLNKNGDLYLLYASADNGIYGQNLTNDGLSLLTNRSTTILSAALPWEMSGPMTSPAVVQRGNISYVFYTASDQCNASRVIAVARSVNPFGPYEKMPTPFLIDEEGMVGPGYGTVTKGVDLVDGREYDLLIFQAWESSHDVCAAVVYLFTVRFDWGSDGWPAAPANSTLRALRTNLTHKPRMQTFD